MPDPWWVRRPPPIQPMEQPKQPAQPGKLTTAGLIGAGLAIMLGQVLDRGEGNELKAYRDSIGIPTICRGVIRNSDGTAIRMGQVMTQAECDSLNDAETVEHLLLAFRAVPQLKEGCPVNGGTQCRWPGPLLAFASLTYNIGGGAANRSTVARHFRAGRWYEGCVAFAMWRRAGGREIRGLALRRAWEQSDLCFVGIPIPNGVRVPPPSPTGRAWERQLRAMGARA